MVKNPHANAGDIRDAGSIPGSGRSPGGGRGNPLQDSCLENPTDRGARRATVHGVKKSQTQLNTHAGSYQTEEVLFYFYFYEFLKKIRNRCYILLFYASVDMII